MSVLEVLGSLGVVAVLRSPDARAAHAAVDDLVAGGLFAVEVTFTVPDAAAVIADLVGRDDVLVGAGTVTTPDQAHAALEAGARFLVAPVLAPFLVDRAEAAGALGIPGTATPTEVWEAVAAGAQAVKVFPAATLGGPDYLRQLLAPMPGLRLMPSGGIPVTAVADYRAAGAWCVGLGGGLVAAAAGAERRRLAAEAVAAAARR